MAHQTFYIDIDEEITSIAERLKGARANEIIMVVPKRALLIQSIVNLRILKKEADEKGLQLMIVTQDKLGKMLVEKAGILVQQKMENISEDEIALNENKEIEHDYYGAAEELNKNTKTSSRLNKIGSENFFGEEKTEEEKNKLNEMQKIGDNFRKNEENKEKLINRELVTEIGKNLGQKSPGMKMDMDLKPKQEIFSSFSPAVPVNENTLRQNNKIENFFNQNNSYEKQKVVEDDLKNYSISGKAHKWFWIFGLICIFAAVGVLVYLFLPKATVTIASKIKTKAIDSQIIGDANSSSADYDKEIVPIRIITADQEISEKFDSTGNQSASGKKARGKVTIYNEYSSSSQPLVATTRFLSENGKLFRLAAGVVVPGTTNENGTIKPGIIEAEVVADEAGDNFNIDAAKFTIPGFKDSGNEKYTKIYAQSKEAMAGGSSNGQTARSITDSDITSAKSKMTEKLDIALKQKIKELAGEGVIILDDTISKEEAAYKLSNSAGEVADSFQITIQGKASAIAVSEKDLKDMAARNIAKAGNGQADVESDSITFDFGKSDANFKTGIVNIKFHASGKIKPDFNLDNIKKEILGKNEDDLKAYLSQYSDIETVSVEYWPSFITGRIPFQEKRVAVTLDNN